MKTSNFKKRINELGYTVEDSADAIFVYSNNRILARVSTSKINKLDTIWERDIPHELFHVLINYVSTPIEKREEVEKVEKFYLYNPVRDAYFNYYVEEGRHDWLDTSQVDSVIQTQFTQKEIENHKCREIMELLQRVEVK